MMMVVMMVMPVRSRADPNVNAGTMVMMVMMVMSDHNLGNSGPAALRQPFVIGLQKRHSVRDRIEKVAIAGGLRKFRPDHRRGLGGAHRGRAAAAPNRPATFLSMISP
jgi:hypothetical protein